MRAPSRPGLTVHRTASLRPDETLILDGIPVTTPSRTILDLAPSLTSDELEQLVAEACAQQANPSPARRAARPLPAAQGHPPVEAAARATHGPAFTRSPPERLLLNLLRDAELPPPETNARVRDYEVDVLWRELRLVAEFDWSQLTRRRIALAPRIAMTIGRRQLELAVSP